jgi:predicted dithiol-disulfide oxidoreductase (DUF899 family)
MLRECARPEIVRDNMGHVEYRVRSRLDGRLRRRSFRSDHVDGALAHLEHFDVSFVKISRAPLLEIEAFKRRMGWRFGCLLSYGKGFNCDYRVSFTKEDAPREKIDYIYGPPRFISEEMSGLSVFSKDDTGEIFHTYSTFGRGDEMVGATYIYLDVTPKGGNETGPHFNLGDWVRHHDGHGVAGMVDAGGRFVAAQLSES